MRPRSIAALAPVAVTAATLDAALATAGKPAAAARPATGGPANVDARSARPHDVRPDTAQQAAIRSLRPAAVHWNAAHGTPASVVRTGGSGLLAGRRQCGVERGRGHGDGCECSDRARSHRSSIGMWAPADPPAASGAEHLRGARPQPPPAV